MGSGLMIRKEWINFDNRILSHGGRSTDVVGEARDISTLFEKEVFSGVVAFHVLEHFIRDEAIKLLSYIFSLLKRQGKLIVECPDVLGMYDFYIKRKKDIQGLIYGLMGGNPEGLKYYGEGAYHRSGWTGPLMAEQMEKSGFKIKSIGIGLSHGMGSRDFRVEGFKP